MSDFFRTVRGQRFFESTLPNLVVELCRIANALEKIADAQAAREAVASTLSKETRGQ